jgi:hypothetical protein
MKEIWTLDAETDPFKAGRIPKPFVWGLYNGGEYHKFYDTNEMVDFLEQMDVIVYAHNGGKFDYHFFLDRLEQFEPLMVIGGRLARFKIGLCEFRDSYNILPFPLSAYQKDEIDYNIFEADQRDKPHNKIEIEKYLKSDCVYLWDMITQFIDRYGLHLTQAGAAMKVWQKIADQKAPETNQLFYNTLSPFYYGGRVECFYNGLVDHEFKVIDINSAYPFAMKHAHPYGNNFIIGDELPATTKKIQQCFITVNCVSHGAFPFRSSDGLIFPNDDIKRTYYISGWEFLAAIDTRTIDDYDIIEVMRFSETIRFDDYIDHFYKQKDECKKNDDKAGYIFAKLFLNSLYGKFGANPDNYNEYTIVKPRYIEAAEQDGYMYCAELGKWALCTKPLDDDKRRYYNVAVAASITGFVRAQMWRSMNECNGVMYCDTDSIACTDTGNLEIDPSTLGAWDIEAQCDYGGIAGKKLYAFHDKNTGKWKTASKGVRFTPEQILEVAKGHETKYNPIAPSFSLKRGVKFISRRVNKKVVIQKQAG